MVIINVGMQNFKSLRKSEVIFLRIEKLLKILNYNNIIFGTPKCTQSGACC